MKMTLDEAIKRAEEKAKELKNFDNVFFCTDEYKKNCLKCAEEHEQLAFWLKELKYIKEYRATWIQVGTDEYECDRCGYIHRDSPSSYCANCGSEMIGTDYEEF